MSESYSENYRNYKKERDSIHFKMRFNGGYSYCCSYQYPIDYYNLCSKLYYKYFDRSNFKIKEAKEKYMRCMNLSYQEFREARQQGKDGFELFEPLIEKPKGVEINLDGYTAIMKDWEVIATAGGQFDPE